MKEDSLTIKLAQADNYIMQLQDIIATKNMEIRLGMEFKAGWEEYIFLLNSYTYEDTLNLLLFLELE